MPKARTLDVEAGRYQDSSSSGGGSVAALAVLALVGVAGTAGALYYVEAQLSALQVSFDRQRQQTDDAFAKHVTALQELHRAQEDVRKLATAGKAAGKAAQPAAPSADEEGEDRKKRRRKEAKEAKARAKAKDEDEDEEKDESSATGKGKKDEEGVDEQKDEVRPRHWAGVTVSPDSSIGGPFTVRALWPYP